METTICEQIRYLDVIWCVDRLEALALQTPVPTQAEWKINNNNTETQHITHRDETKTKNSTRHVLRQNR